MNCARCDHQESDHCKGGDLHSCHKEDVRMIPIKYRVGSVICASRHCLQPLCSCIAFIEPKQEAA